ncbi:MAG: apolipoprotein N-acyltransferase [Alphaproteobacteria bacterium]|nr:apolipoprotein N-acyltransferase [Alphaproteobacteria bacterium]
MKLNSIQSSISSLTGVKKYATAFGLGVFMTLAMPPIGAFYVLLVCVPGIIWLTRQSKTKSEAFLTGWAFGAGYFIFGLYWISFALFVDIGTWWWVLPLSAIAGPAVLALYYALIPLVIWRYRTHEAAYALMLVAGWSMIEWVRGHALTGFPWNLSGYTWHYFPSIMQTNALIGIYGLSLLTLLWAVMPVLALTPQKKLVPILLVSFLLVAVAGTARLVLHPAMHFDNVAVRIVQPNIPQSTKWDQDEEWRNFKHHLDLTASATTLKQPITFVVWPETAVVADLKQFPEIAKAIAKSLPEESIALLGSLRTTVESGTGKFYNSVTVLDKKAKIIDTYDKHHLVPFGEYIPFRNFLNMTPVASGIARIGDFTRGTGVSSLHIGSLPKPSPLVCYEAIFPGTVASRKDRPDWLLNVTNDAWYGKTAGPHQHFEITRVRAIEEGLPLVRSANTGISAVIDPLGRIIGIKPLGETGVVDTQLPRPLPPTPYSRTGDLLFFLMLAMLAIFGEKLHRSGES